MRASCLIVIQPIFYPCKVKDEYMQGRCGFVDCFYCYTDEVNVCENLETKKKGIDRWMHELDR